MNVECQVRNPNSDLSLMSDHEDFPSSYQHHRQRIELL
jgi:hypothetical protein